MAGRGLSTYGMHRARRPCTRSTAARRPEYVVEKPAVAIGSSSRLRPAVLWDGGRRARAWSHSGQDALDISFVHQPTSSSPRTVHGHTAAVVEILSPSNRSGSTASREIASTPNWASPNTGSSTSPTAGSKVHRLKPQPDGTHGLRAGRDRRGQTPFSAHPVPRPGNPAGRDLAHRVREPDRSSDSIIPTPWRYPHVHAHRHSQANPLNDNPLSRAAATRDLEAIARLGEARKKLKEEIAKVIIGQEHIVDDLLTAAVRARPLPDDRRARPGQDADGPHHRPAPSTSSSTASSSRPTSCRRTSPAPRSSRKTAAAGTPRSSASSRARCSPTSCSPTRSTARRPRPRPPCSRPCRSCKSPSAGRTYDLPRPFFVLATQNPIEQEGTYPLPEAQLDRFMFDIRIGYPEAARGTGDRQDRRRRTSRSTSPRC